LATDGVMMSYIRLYKSACVIQMNALLCFIAIPLPPLCLDGLVQRQFYLYHFTSCNFHHMTLGMTEQVDVVVTQCTCIQGVFGSKLDWDTSYPD
jgi:hypothetical protein